MIIRFLLRILANEHVINRLADSYPVRRAAKMTVYFFNRTKSLMSKDQMTDAMNPQNLRKMKDNINEFARKFKK